MAASCRPGHRAPPRLAGRAEPGTRPRRPGGGLRHAGLAWATRPLTSRRLDKSLPPDAVTFCPNDLRWRSQRRVGTLLGVTGHSAHDQPNPIVQASASHRRRPAGRGVRSTPALAVPARIRTTGTRLRIERRNCAELHDQDGDPAGATCSSSPWTEGEPSGPCTGRIWIACQPHTTAEPVTMAGTGQTSLGRLRRRLKTMGRRSLESLCAYQAAREGTATGFRSQSS